MITHYTAQVATTETTVHLLTIPQLVTQLLSVTDPNTNNRYCASAIESSSSCNVSSSVKESHEGDLVSRSSVSSVGNSKIESSESNFGGSINESHVVDNSDLPCESSVISVGASTIEASGSNIGGSITESHVVHNGDLLLGSSVLSVGESQIKIHGYNVRFDHPLFTFRSTEVVGVDIHYRSELYPDIEK